MKQASAWMTGLALTLVLTGAASAQALSATTERAIDATMQQAITGRWIVGGAVGVMREGKVVFVRGYGMANLDGRAPVTPDTVFEVGAINRQFIAAGLLLLAEDGALSLDDRVGAYLPQLPKDDPTTVRQLLNHTAGFTDAAGAAGAETSRSPPPARGELVGLVLSRSPAHDFPPGADFRLANANYVLAAAVLERVSGQPLGAFLKARIFDRLDMTSTVVEGYGAPPSRRARGYERSWNGPPGYVAAATSQTNQLWAAGGVLRSTVGDLLLWSHALVAGGVLKADSYRQMLSPARLNDGARASLVDTNDVSHAVDYGLGVEVLGAPGRLELVHEGAINGFSATLTIYADADAAVAVLVNTSPSLRSPASGVTEAVRRELTAQRLGGSGAARR